MLKINKFKIFFLIFICFLFSISLNVYASDGKIYIDYPYDNYGAKGVLNFQGWVMTDVSDAKLEISIDDQNIDEEDIKREEREDVLKTINGYGGRELNAMPGFYGQVDISNLECDKTYNFVVKLVDSNNNVISKSSKKIVIKQYEAQMYLDLPHSDEIVKKNMKIQGWLMSNDPKANI